MSPVRLVDDERHAKRMCIRRNFPDRLHDSLVGRRCNHNCVRPLPAPLTEIEIIDVKPAKVSRVIDRDMAASLDQDSPSRSHSRGYGGQYPDCTPVHKKIRFLRPVKGLREVHFSADQVLRIVQVVKAVYLRDIGPADEIAASLVSRHVEGIHIRRGIVFQLFLQFSHRHALNL